MIASDMVTWIATLLSLTPATSIFLNSRPNGKEAPNVVSVWDCPTYDNVNGSGLAMDNWGVQIEFRNKAAANAKSQAMIVHKAIMGFSGQLHISSPVVDVVTCDQVPYALGQDEDMLHTVMSKYRLTVESTGDAIRI